MSKILVITGGIAVILFSFLGRNDAPAELSPAPTLTKGDIEIELIIADTPAKRTQGLSEHNGLKQNQGMLFVFEEEDHHGIWMKDMLFPLDIIWLTDAPAEVSAQAGKDDERRMVIVDVQKNAGPESFPKIYSPKEKAFYVLEVNAGFLDKNNIKIGDVLTLSD